MAEVTVVLRPSTPNDLRAEEEDIAYVRDLAERHGVTVVLEHRDHRTVHVTGSTEDLTALADDVDDRVVAVLGLSDKKVAHPHLITARAASGSLTALQVARAYNFPASDGAGQAIAIIELGGGFGQADLDTYFAKLGVPKPEVTSISVAGGKNQSDGADGADGEVLLDIEVAGAVAPGAKIGVYFAPNTDAGFLSAINAAIHDATLKPSVISISWGAAESQWDAKTMDAYNASFAQALQAGITVLAAAGDTGSQDGTGTDAADFPASSPCVVACGGTRLGLGSSGDISSETVWNDDPSSSATGGGYSAHFAKPDFQSGVITGTKRGEPDLTGNADPNSGYQVYVDGQWYVIGGTSAVAPLYAGLVARLNALAGRRVGSLNYLAYANPTAFRDVTQGNNGTFRAGPGWDAASGLGSPDGSKLLDAFRGGTVPTPPPTPDPGPQPVPTPTGGEGCFQYLGLSPGAQSVVRSRAKRRRQTPDQWIADRVRAALR